MMSGTRPSISRNNAHADPARMPVFHSNRRSRAACGGVSDDVPNQLLHLEGAATIIATDHDAGEVQIVRLRLHTENEKIIRPHDRVGGGVAQRSHEWLLVAHIMARRQYHKPGGRIALQDAQQAHENSERRAARFGENDEIRGRQEPQRAFQLPTVLLRHHRPDALPVSSSCGTIQDVAQQ